MPVQNTWANADRTGFVWVRRFDNVEGTSVRDDSFGT